MKVAAIQMVSGTEVKTNLQAAQALMAQAVHEGAELLVLPEYFCLMGQREADKLAWQEPLGKGLIQDWLASTAQKLGAWIVGGTLPLACEPARADKCRNACLVFDPPGRRVAHYDKIHLFCFNDGRRAYDEAVTLVPGQRPVMFELPSRDGHVWRIGLSVCYDLRFAELYRSYAVQGADLLLVSSAFTYETGQAHWEVLLRARAIENLCGVVAAAQGGEHANGRRTCGQSMVIDAWGHVLARHAQNPAVVLAELRAEDIALRRQQLPALSHRVL